MPTQTKYAITTQWGDVPNQGDYDGYYANVNDFFVAIGGSHGNMTASDTSVIAEIFTDAGFQSAEISGRNRFQGGNFATGHFLTIQCAPGHKYEVSPGAEGGAVWGSTGSGGLLSAQDDCCLLVQDIALKIDPNNGAGEYVELDDTDTQVTFNRVTTTYGYSSGFGAWFQGNSSSNRGNLKVLNSLIRFNFDSYTQSHIGKWGIFRNCSFVRVTDQSGQNGSNYVVTFCDVHDCVVGDDLDLCFENCNQYGNNSTGDSTGIPYFNQENVDLFVNPANNSDYASHDYHPLANGNLDGTGTAKDPEDVYDFDGLVWADNKNNIGCFSTSDGVGGGTGPTGSANAVIVGTEF